MAGVAVYAQKPECLTSPSSTSSDWESVLHPKSGQAVLLKRRGYLWGVSTTWAAANVVTAKGWIIHIDRNVFDRREHNIGTVAKICASLSEAEELAREMNAVTKAVIEAMDRAKEGGREQMRRLGLWTGEGEGR